MSLENIQSSLTERFSAPLPEFHTRRIIFWHDNEKEFESLVDGLKLDNVVILKLSGTNNFAMKKFVTVDDTVSNILIYNPVFQVKDKKNWLLDVEMYSEAFFADLLSMQMAELCVEDSSIMRKTLRLYTKFLSNKSRVHRLKSIGRSYQHPVQFHIDIMAVLCGLSAEESTAQAVIMAVLMAGLEKESNTALAQMEKLGNLAVFWQMVQSYTGYVHDDGGETTLRDFACHLTISALAHTVHESSLKGLERYISDTCKSFCYDLVHQWQLGQMGQVENSTKKNKDKKDALYTLCREIEDHLKLESRFDTIDFEYLLGSNVFPCVDECILKRLFGEIKEQVIRTDTIAQAVEKRRTYAWYDLFAMYYDALQYMGLMEQFYRENQDFNMASPEKVWKFYTQEAYIFDSYYRHFHHAFSCTLKDANPVVEDILKENLSYFEGLYQQWYLKELTSTWLATCGGDLAKLGYVSEIPRQKDFYNQYLAYSKNARTFVIISDALRYEVAAELREKISNRTSGHASLESIQAIFPSITKFGMAALLPHKELSLHKDMAVLADGQSTVSTDKRHKALCERNKNSIAIQYQDLMNMRKAERRDLVSGKEIIYIYHNSIDAIGDKRPTEHKVFEACKTAIDEILHIMRIITGELSGTHILITADHGFLYTHTPLTESQKISQSTFEGKTFEVGRRYAIASTDTNASYLQPVAMNYTVENEAVIGYTPMDATRIKVSGGGENYVHGGVSLQEMVVPVVIYKNVRSSQKNYTTTKNAELGLLNENKKISNMLITYDFYQVEAISNKVQPCTYQLYFIDENNEKISDVQMCIADRTSANVSERIFKLKFSLKSMKYDKTKVYRLKIDNGTDIPKEVEFEINIAFAVDDFGFDI